MIKDFHLKVKLNHKDAKVPTRSFPTDAGFDLYSVDTLIIEPGGFEVVGTGISIELSKNFEAQIRPRSGMAAKHGVTVLNSPGTIDQNYRGEIKVILINHGDCFYSIKKGDRIAQMVFKLVYSPILEIVSTIKKTDRNGGGFGSTGK